MKRLYLFIIYSVFWGMGMTAQTDRYAEHSVLASGHWVKIRIPATGYYELTDSLLNVAGLNPTQVKVYGYGGALQPERLDGNYLKTTDDLEEVPLCVTPNGRRIFFGTGPVNWAASATLPRIRNPYSDYGYYFLTDSEGEPMAVDSAALAGKYYPHPNDYHTLYESDDFSWYNGGRNLYDGKLFEKGKAQEYSLSAYAATGKVYVAMSYQDFIRAEVLINDSLLGYILVDESTSTKAYPDKYSTATADVWTFTVPQGLKAQNTITIRQLSGSGMRLDYISLVSDKPRLMPILSKGCPVPEFVGTVSNQDLHGHTAADMIIIIPANRQLQEEAERLAALHREKDTLRVRVVAADELFNEFSSGTPDANAYRRYLKMLYDRAADETEKPRFLLLMGDGAWDNRLVSSEWKGIGLTADELLLCYESENSFSKTQCYVADDFFCMLDDGEGTDMLTRDIGDMAVGRLPVRMSEQAKIVVDKIIGYRNNDYAGNWQNTVFFMGDDGDNNRHMRDADIVARQTENLYPDFHIKKVYWDSYMLTTTQAGERYPDVSQAIKHQMQQGALIMNYTGHGAPSSLSHEFVLQRSDFEQPTSQRLPLWVTASCDIMSFDGHDMNIGETALLNPDGGAIAFFGTVHTVYANKNMPINRSFMKYVLMTENGRRLTMGEAARRAKTELIEEQYDMAENKLQYALLGDPALALATPILPVVIDSINGQLVTEGQQRLAAGEEVTVTGYIPNQENFNGVVTITVLDAEVHAVCRMNDSSDMDYAFEYNHRPDVVFVASDSVKNGRFKVTFAIPLDISYAEGEGMMMAYAVNEDHTLLAHGRNSDFSMGSGDNDIKDSEGPTIACYLEYRGFESGSSTSHEPFFYAQIVDDDGINVSGNGIGHDMELIIDDELLRTYNLNDYFIYDLGDYRRGEVGFSIPWLPSGSHHLVFRAWDILNHSGTYELEFYVDDQYDPTGIQGVLNDEWFSRRREQMEGMVFDASGRFVGGQIPRRPGLYVFKSRSGLVKKIIVKGNN